MTVRQFCVPALLISCVNCTAWSSPACSDANYTMKREIAKDFREGKGFLLMEHVHKAAGSTLCHLLKKSPSVKIANDYNCNFKKGAWRSIPHDMPATELEETLRSTDNMNFVANEDAPFPHQLRHKLFHPFGANSNSSSRWSFVTILRNPIDRIVSHFKFEGLSSYYKNISVWVERSPFHTHNFMVRKFASLYPPDFPEKELHNPHTHWGNLLDKSKNKNKFNSPSTLPAVTEEDFERAKSVLSQFSVIVILEWLSETAPLLGYYFDVPVLDLRSRDFKDILQKDSNLLFHRDDEKKRRAQPFYEYVASQNVYDLMLYNYAKNLTKCNIEDTYFHYGR